MEIYLGVWRVTGWSVPELVEYDSHNVSNVRAVLDLVERRLPSPTYDAGSRILDSGEATLREAWDDPDHPARDFAGKGVKLAVANYTDGERYHIVLHWADRD